MRPRAVQRRIRPRSSRGATAAPTGDHRDCRSGRKAANGSHSAAVMKTLPHPTALKSRRDQQAPESAELGAGFLTYLVDQALKGKGDVDPRDGWISSQEVAKFTYQALPELFLAQREKNPKAFSNVFGSDVQEPDVYTIGADLMIAKTGQ